MLSQCPELSTQAEKLIAIYFFDLLKSTKEPLDESERGEWKKFKA